MANLNRKQFLGGLGCAAAGMAAGAYIPSALAPEPSLAPSAVPAAPRPTPRVPRPEPPLIPLHGGEESFSQCGEDVNMYFIFKFFSMFGAKEITYLDVGAHDPVEINNTYFFYRKGWRGVLVEPNGAYCEKLRAVRPEDATLEAGIGVGEAKEADYYLMNASALNTFSKEQAERLEAEGKFRIEEVRKVPFLNINDVMEKHFHGAPSFISIDTEGLDFEILKTVDFARYRPKILCVETLVTDTSKTRPEIGELLAARNYVQRGGSLVNSIFIDGAHLA